MCGRHAAFDRHKRTLGFGFEVYLGGMSDNDARHAAVQRLQRKRGFMNYVVGAIGISILMVIIWFLSGRGYFWPMWVMGGFAIGLIFMGIGVFTNKPITEDEIQQEMKKGS